MQCCFTALILSLVFANFRRKSFARLRLPLEFLQLYLDSEIPLGDIDLLNSGHGVYALRGGIGYRL